MSVDRVEVHGQPTFVDQAATDDLGKLRVAMAPSRRQFFAARLPLGYEPATKASLMLALEAGGTTTARFEFKQQPEPAGRPEEDEVGRRLRSLWEAQARLIDRGRMRATRTYQAGDSISTDRLRQLLESLDPKKVPPLLDLIRATFPDAATVYNGRKSVQYNPGNAQVNIGDDGPKSRVRFAVASLDDFCRRPGWGGKVVGRAHGRVTLESRSGDHLSRIVVDEATGFVYRESLWWIGANSGQERWQFAPRVAANGAIIPGLCIDFTYPKDVLSVAWIKAIQSVELDALVPPETFLVAVPPGTLILDDREGCGDNRRGLARRLITDVVAYADADPRRFRTPQPPVKVGQPTPAIDAVEWLERVVKVPAPSLWGKVVLVDFWGIECGPCVAQLPEVREAAGDFEGRGLAQIGLHHSSGTPAKVAEFASKRNLIWTLAVDRPGDGFGATFAA